MKKQYLTCDCDIAEDIELQECRVISEALHCLTGQKRDSHSRPLPHLPIPDCLPLLEPIIEVIK